MLQGQFLDKLCQIRNLAKISKGLRAKLGVCHHTLVGVGGIPNLFKCKTDLMTL